MSVSDIIITLAALDMLRRLGLWMVETMPTPQPDYSETSET